MMEKSRQQTKKEIQMNTDVNLCSIVKGRGFDAAFYGVWLQRVAQAEQHLRTLRKSNAENLARLDGVYVLDLQIAAINLISNVSIRRRVRVEMDSYEAELLAIFSALGLLIRKKGEYVLAVPLAMKAKDVAKAIAVVVNTEDDEYMLHPARLLSCRPVRGTSASLARL
jgi:hypothetical protein